MTHDNNSDLTSITFPQFDIVSDIPDHYFLTPNNPNQTQKPEGSCFKAMSKEFRILQENLPNSIFIRVSETRFDLLRAAIIGVAGTPYHDGVFIFDIAITADYPNQPPKLHYHSHGYQINPNLKHNGFVCLSLLNTWYGHKAEKWNPKQSTLLQVLISLQSLVLNEKPYHNFPVFSYFLSDKGSECYSQDAFFFTCWSSVQLMRNPPANFERLIRWHFRDRANVILAACEAYANGRVMIGFYGCDGQEKLPGFKIRERFQRDMEVVYCRLVEEFRLINVDVPVARERLVVVRNPPVVLGKTKKKAGILRRIMGKMRRIF